MIRHLKLLLFLRWKYLWRAGGATRRIGFAVSVVLALTIGGGLFLLLSLALGRGFERQPHPVMWEFVHLAFAVLYVAWLYAGTMSDLYDPARLAPYPVAPRTIFLGSTLASFVGTAPLYAGAIIAGFAIGIPGTAVQKIARAAILVLMILHLQMVGRLIRLAFLAVLTSRRWRDAALLVSTLLGGGIYLSTRLIPRENMDQFGRKILEFAQSGGVSAWLGWFPGVWISWGHELDGAKSAFGLAAFALLTVAVYRAGGRVEERLAFSEPVFYYRRRKAAPGTRARFLKGASRAIAGLLGPVAAGVARKESAVFFRDPVVRHRILTGFFYVLIPILAPFFAKGQIPFQSAGEVAGFLLLFAEMAFLTNLFGLEGSAVRTLLGFPAARRSFFLGKNLAYLAILAPVNAIVIATPLLIGGAVEKLPTILAYHLASLVVVMAVGNVNSVYFPLPFLAPGQRMTRQDEGGCLMGLARLSLYFLTLALLSPVAAAAFLLERSGWPAAALAAVPMALAYAGMLYAIGLKFAERALIAREERLGDYFRAA
jgi:hypothetical protein